jgi:hypothetical protein
MNGTMGGELDSMIRNSSGPQIWQISIELGKQENRKSDANKELRWLGV